jgi:hypothetical protein
MIEVKLSFASQAELLAFFAGTKPLVSADEKAAVASITAPVKEATTKPGKPQPAPTPAATGADLAALATTAAGSPSEPPKSAAAQPAAAQQSAASTAASSASTSGDAIDYSVLQKAVFALAGKSRETMVEMCAARGVKTFKELPADQWADALAEVNAALAKLG